MRNLSPRGLLFEVAVLLCRLSLGLIFFFAGLRKMIPTEVKTFVTMLKDFAAGVASEAPMPEPLGLAYGYALPFVELLAGLLLIVGLFGRVAAALISLMLLSFIIAMGVDWWPEAGPAFDKNVVFFTLAFLLIFTGAGTFSIDHLMGKSYKVAVEVK